MLDSKFQNFERSGVSQSVYCCCSNQSISISVEADENVINHSFEPPALRLSRCLIDYAFHTCTSVAEGFKPACNLPLHVNELVEILLGKTGVHTLIHLTPVVLNRTGAHRTDSAQSEQITGR